MSLPSALIVAHGHAASNTPAAVVAVAVLAVLLVVLAGGWILARWLAWEPRWWRRLGHVGAEAGVHLELSWAEFRDWLRLGR